ncbi:MAG: hypothetical protein H6831_03280 [Planctomycetes bacterium]|nr:hypothetical protein [Planctomycetota bacterium]MCB9903407.1 hypothetical protein [Planctomycetota bacterium]
MAKLILEEGGARRAFRFKEGKLTVGSGEGCTLTLTSPGVEELHATLVIKGGRAVLSTSAGAEPPRMNGRPVAERVELPAECSFTIGDATFELHADEGESASAAAGGAKRPAVRKQAAPSTRPAPRAGSRGPARKTTSRDADTGDRPERVTARRREVKAGMPTWVLMLLLLGGAVGIVFGVKAFFDASNTASFDPGAQLADAVTAINKAQYLAAETALDKFDGVADQATDAQKQKARELRAVIAESGKASTRQGVLDRATQVLDAKLKKFVDQRLAGNLANRARARVFVMRCQEFRKLYPDHPEIDWVNRYEARFAEMAQMDEPRTLEDLQYEVETCTWTATGRRYDQVFKAIDEFLEYAEGGDREAALALRDEKLAERQAHQVDRMQEIRYRWEKGETGKAMAHFVYHLKWWGDEEMENQVAAEITKLGGFPEWLRSFKKSAPEDFDVIVKNRYVREVAEREGLL